MKKSTIVFVLLSLILPAFSSANSFIHPENRKLVKLGMMKMPKYYPEIPRISALAAKHYYETNKATVVLVSYTDHDRILGGLHLTEDLPPKINPNTLLRQKDHILLVYCP